MDSVAVGALGLISLQYLAPVEDSARPIERGATLLQARGGELRA
jgi:hypothetical protein